MHDRMQQLCAASSILHSKMSLITCSGIATKFDVQTSCWNSAKIKMSEKGKRLQCQTKKVINGVCSYLKSHAKKARISSSVLEQTAKATSMSWTTVCSCLTITKTVARWWLFRFTAKALPTKLKTNHLRRLWPGAIRWHIYCLYEQKVNITLDQLLLRILLWFIFNA